jgi:hypothetical protein
MYEMLISFLIPLGWNRDIGSNPILAAFVTYIRQSGFQQVFKLFQLEYMKFYQRQQLTLVTLWFVLTLEVFFR